VVEARPVDAARGLAGRVPGEQVALTRAGDHLEQAVAVEVADGRRADDPLAGELGPAGRLGALPVPGAQVVAARAVHGLGEAVAVDVGDDRVLEELPVVDALREAVEVMVALGRGLLAQRPGAQLVIEVRAGEAAGERLRRAEAGATP